MKRFLLAAALLASASAFAQAYPTKPVRVIVPWPAGGSNDTAARIVMQKMGETLGQQYVPFRGGPPAMTALIAGGTQASVATLPNALPQVQAGKLKALAVTTAARTAMLPALPTVAEAGVAGYEWNPWIGLMGPAGLKRDMVDRLNGEIGKALSDVRIRKSLVAQGLEAQSATPDAFEARLRADVVSYEKLIRSVGLTID